MLTRSPGRADRDPAAHGRLPQERRRHQDGRRRHRAGLRARLHHDVRDRHRRQRLHPAGAQAARAQQAGHRRRRRGVDVGAAAAGVRRVPLLRPAGGRRGPPRPAGAAPRPRRPRPRPARRATPVGRGARAGEPRPPAAPDDATSPCSWPRPLAGLQRSCGGPVLGVDAEAHDAAQGPDVQRGRLRVPRLRRAAAPPRRAQRGRAAPRARAKGDPEVTLPEHAAGDDEAFALLVDVVERLQATAARPRCRA